MMKNIIITILLLIVIACGGFGYYLYQINPSFFQKPDASGIQNLEAQNQGLVNKIQKALIYTTALDLIMEPTRQQTGLATKKEITNEEWRSQVFSATDNTGDATLKEILERINASTDPKASSDAVMEFTDYAIKAILANLRN